MKRRLSLLTIPFLLLASFATSCLAYHGEASDATAVYAEDEPRSVFFRDASTKINAGEENRVNVAIDDIADLASIKFSVRFLQEQVTINNHWIASFSDRALYEGKLEDGRLTYSIAYEDAHEGGFDLISFTYATKPGVFGGISFLITVEEALDINLESIDIRGTPFSASTIEAGEGDIPMKEVALYTPYKRYVKPYEKVTEHILATGEGIRAGGIEIRYDPERFHYLRLSPGWQLTNAGIVSVVEGRGSLRMSFACDPIDGSFSLASIEFCVKEEFLQYGMYTGISILPMAFYDGDLRSMVPFATNMSVCRYEYYDGITPVTSSISISSPQDGTALRLGSSVDVVISLAEYSFLGAGDFQFTFDTSVFEYLSCTQRVECDYFATNVTKTDQGILSFSILSANNIIVKTDVLLIRLKIVSFANQPNQFMLACNHLRTSKSEPIDLTSDPLHIFIYQEYLPFNEFCQSFLDATGSICSTGNQDNRSSLEGIWPEMKELWLEMDPSHQFTFSVYGYEVDYVYDVQDAAAMRYDYIVKKYGLENFAGRDVASSPLYPSVSSAAVQGETSKTAFYLLGISSFAVIVFALFIHARNKSV